MALTWPTAPYSTSRHQPGAIMGFHVCEYCKSDTSSGDVTIRMKSGKIWQVPDMILHYVADHNYRPPHEFVNDILDSEVVGGERIQTKGLEEPVKIGYLSGPIESVWNNEKFAISMRGEFFLKLWQAMRAATEEGSRRQTHSAR